MNDNVFVDTNILVYARDARFPEKQRQAHDLLAGLWKNRKGRLSIQVCNEYFVTVTGKLKPGLDEATAWDDVEAWFAWNPEPIEHKTLQKAREVQVRYRISWWDSFIVAAAFWAECGTIVSEDLNPDQEYLGMRVVNPFSGSGTV